MMNESTRQEVRSRAGNRCEYCRLKQQHYRLWRHQVEHVIPRKHRGSDDLDNLALACVRCNLGKSSNLSGRDDETAAIVPLFNPRTDVWHEHFAYDGAHDLRRGCARRLINSGVSAETLKVVFRHSSFATTERFYGASRSAQAAATELAEKLNSANRFPICGGIDGGKEQLPQLSAAEVAKLKSFIDSL